MFGRKALKKSLMLLVVPFACTTSVALANECQIQISQPVIDYGNLNPSVLRASAKSAPSISLGKHQRQLRVVCQELKDMAIIFHGAAAGSQSYQIGDKGEYDLILKDARMDGEPVLLGLVSSVGEAVAESGSSVQLTPGQYSIPMKNQAVKIGKVLSMTVEFDTRIYVEALKVRDVHLLEGRGKFELN